MPESERIGIVVQARMGSTRLPGKVLMDIAGKPLLQRLCERLKLTRFADVLVVATTKKQTDDQIADACASWGVAVVRGPERDVTTRFLKAANSHALTAVVRVTADNPLTDPQGIDDLVAAYLQCESQGQERATIVHNAHRRGYPYGTGAEMVARSVLDLCDRELATLEERENFMSFARRHPERFRCIKTNAPPERLRPQYFLTVDYPEDLSLQNQIYQHFEGNDRVSLDDVLSYLDANPHIAEMNTHLHHQFSE